MRRNIALVTALVFCFCLGVGAQQKISDIFRGTLETYGLSHLPEDDKVKVRDLLDGMNGAMTKVYREKAEVYDSAIDYWKNQGYEPEDISFVRRDNRWLLVVGKTFPVYTTDYPLLFPIDTLPSGRYLVRKAIGSGISEIIVKGTIQDFRLAKWQSLGR